MVAKNTLNNLDNFLWNRIDKNGPNGCWLWLGGLNTNGYGHTRFEGKEVTTHRLVYSILKGNIPSGLYICHHCDNRICCNPDHLFIGTAQDNATDMVVKGRHIPNMAVGSKNGHSVLTETEVLEIRKLRKEGKSLLEIGKRFNINFSHVSNICSRRQWKHI